MPEVPREHDLTKASVNWVPKGVSAPRAESLSATLSPHRLTCPWNDDNEAATGGQLADDREVVAEGLGVRDEVGRHC